VDFRLWPLAKQLTSLPYQVMQDSVYYQKPVRMQRKMFTDKVVPISVNYPFFFKPIQDGMDRPKTELAYSVPASKLTSKVDSAKDNQREIELAGS
jgi:hypothetical protein